MNFIKLRFIPYTFSTVLVVLSIIFLIIYGLNFSTEFKGGTNVVFKSATSEKELRKIFQDSLKQDLELKKIESGFSLSIKKSLEDKDLTLIKNTINDKTKNSTISEVSVVSATVGKELITKTAIAILVSVFVIFVFVTYSFKNNISAISAILAMLHDTLILLGFFAFFGKYFGAEVDLLFVTAVLTVLSFSLYDTIVIFDRVRENIKRQNVADYEFILDRSVKQTMVRSINNSLTSILALFALSLFVSGSIYWFSVALLIGVIFGTYSSPFVAVNLFYDLEKLLIKLKSR